MKIENSSQGVQPMVFEQGEVYAVNSPYGNLYLCVCVGGRFALVALTDGHFWRAEPTLAVLYDQTGDDFYIPAGNPRVVRD